MASDRKYSALSKLILKKFFDINVDERAVKWSQMMAKQDEDQVQIRELTNFVSACKQQIEGLTQELDTSRRNLASVQKEKQRSEDNCDRLKFNLKKANSAIDKLQDEQKKLQNQVNDYKSIIRDLDTSLGRRAEELEKCYATIDTLKNNLADSELHLREATCQLEGKQQETNQLQAQIAELEKLLSEQKDAADSQNEMIQNQRAQINSFTQDLTSKDSIIQTLNAKLTEVGAQLKEAIKESEKWQEETSKIQTEKSELENQLSELKKASSAQAEETRKLQERVSAMQTEKNSMESQVAGLNSALIQKESENAGLNNRLDKLLQENSELKSAALKCEKELQSAQQERDQLQKALSESQSQTTERKSEVERLGAMIAQLQEQACKRPSITDEIKDLENQIQYLNETLSDSRREVDIYKNRLQQKDGEINEIGQALAEANSQLKELREKYDEAENTIIELKREIEELKALLNKQPEVGPVNDDTTDAPDDQSPAEPIENNQIDDDQAENHPSVPIESASSKETTIKPRRHPHIITKEEKVIEMSGSFIMNFPPITNDSNKNARRSIEYVYDKDGRRVYADSFFGKSAEEISRKSRELVLAGLINSPDFICGMCRRPVKIAHRIINGTESLFFAHATRNEYCAWTPFTTESKDEIPLFDDIEIESEEQYEGSVKPNSRILKEKIFALLCTPRSQQLGISDVKCDAIVRSSVPYMKWRRPDISFKYHDKDVVIVLQRKKHDLRTIVDRDVFFRLNNCYIIWVFGADNDVSYDYMRMSNYKNTLFDCHRNVFVFDKDAQQKSEDNNTLCLKYNWLDENDDWAITIEKNKVNGLIANLSDFQFDDIYFKPYIKEANEPYFNLHPDAREQYLETKKTREQLIDEFENRWKSEPSYEEALRLMKKGIDKATPFQSMGNWGFRYKSTTLIQPIFTEQPVDLHNGFYVVHQGNTAGLVNYYGEVVMDWNILKCNELKVDIGNRRVIFCNGSWWGVADFTGDILIKPQFSEIRLWTDAIYRVRKKKSWGLHNVDDSIVTDCIYESIGELVSDRAEATKVDKQKNWVSYKGLLDANGNELITQTQKLSNDYMTFECFEKWGIQTKDSEVIVPARYQDIQPWTEEAARVKLNGKWGVIHLPDGDILLEVRFDSIGDLIDGTAQISDVGVNYIVDADGKFHAQQSIKLHDGFVKSLVGGKWGIEKDGMEIIPHKYDEIGSFRQRLIGVMNGSIFKLNAYYDYPIKISGKCISLSTKNAQIDIAGVRCSIPYRFIKDAGMANKLYSGMLLNNIAFINLFFNKKQYLLRFVTESQLSKKTSHGDKDHDFAMNEIITGVVTAIKKISKSTGARITKLHVKSKDGRMTKIPRRFFIEAGLDITNVKIGDEIEIQKVGFDDELDQTIWNIISGK